MIEISDEFASYLDWTDIPGEDIPYVIMRDQDPAIGPDVAPYVLPVPFESRDVLVVEDEPYLCDLVADVLEVEGHRARKASNGVDALSRVAEQKPQLILLDLMMPVMDGWEFLAVLRSNPEWKDIPIVIITAVYDVARTQRETGAKAVITKPFDIDQLAEVVRTFSA
jgi:CheY-like chemotaxis protein